MEENDAAEAGVTGDELIGGGSVKDDGLDDNVGAGIEPMI
jgi:hypothetical protein